MSRKKIIYSFLLVLLVVIIWQRPLLYYAFVQAKGQIRVVTDTREVDDILADPQAPDSIKIKLKLIQEVKKFAVDSLGINPSDNYTSVFDQKGKPILWVVTACLPFAMEAKEWSFPLVGSFSYKGFFEYDMAVEEEKKWKDQGYDTNIRTTGGWSTLGWFRDPILSNMLNRKTGDLAELIIHELTHGTLFVKDSLQFNENLATFIGTKGAELFLTQKFGADSQEFSTYIEDNEDSKKFSQHILRGAIGLDSLYQTFGHTLSDDDKTQRKQTFIEEIFDRIDTLSLHRKSDYLEFYKDYEANNTFFMSYLRYRKNQGQFEETLQNDFDNNLKNYLLYLKSQYPSL
ncbi:aminopeptidase [Fulvivirgaceae bacterium BMA12]|uniref:Aminopeptidase n=1 Tax=Agaribacillus aureus TaxID=3051825 RepID=A0ABT8LDU1_9BACT|nr:aminopeptidase [Fulvivirgaceae bacterium BMA12]